MVGRVAPRKNFSALDGLSDSFSEAAVGLVRESMEHSIFTSFKCLSRSLVEKHNSASICAIQNKGAAKLALTSDDVVALRQRAFESLPDYIAAFSGRNQDTKDQANMILGRLGDEGKEILFNELLPEELDRWCILPA